MEELSEGAPKGGGWGYLPSDIIGLICTHLTRLNERRSIRTICRLNVHWRDSVRRHVKKVSLRRFSDVKRAVQCLPNMTHMAIQGDVFTDSDMDFIAKVARLRSLSLHSCRAKRDHVRRDNAATSMAPLGLMTWLQDLEVHDVHGPSPQVLDKVLAKMVHLTQLVWKAGDLYPSRRNIALPTLTYLDRLTSLCALTLINGDHDNPVTLPGLTYLPGLPRLHSLQLQGVGVTDAHLHDIATSLTCLTRLQLCNEDAVTDAGVASVARLTNLRVLQLEIPENQRSLLEPGSITNQGLGHLSSLSHLEDLNLAGVFGISSAGLDFLNNTTGVRKLNLAWLPVPHNGGSLRSLTGVAGLKTLCLAYSIASDEQLLVVRHLPQLEVLDLGFTRTGARTAKSIATLSRLRMLNLRSCDALREALRADSQGCQDLRFLNIDGCRLTGLGVLQLFLCNMGLRFAHQPLQNDTWERHVDNPELRNFSRGLNLFNTFLFTCPASHNVGPNQLRVCFATSTCAVAAEIVVFCCIYIIAFLWVVRWGISKSLQIAWSIPSMCRTLVKLGLVAALLHLMDSAMLLKADIARTFCLLDQ